MQRRRTMFALCLCLTACAGHDRSDGNVQQRLDSSALMHASAAAASTPAQSATALQERSFPRGVISAHLFGMHLIRAWVAGVRWPDAPVGLYRLHDATPRWHHVSAAAARWHDNRAEGTGLSRIEATLIFRDQHGAGTPVLYTLAGGGDDRVSGRWRGGWPAWFTASTDTMAAWRRHVREVGTRFKGRITLWEVWNEADCTCFYVGSVARLVELTRAAAEELRAIDPANRIVAPSFTDGGLTMMEQFYSAGGGAHVDIVALHMTNNFPPERDTTLLLSVRALMNRHGVAAKPLWVTEGHAVAHASTSDAALLARSYLTLWLFGVESYAWYAWDIAQYEPIAGHERTRWVTLTDAQHRVRPAGVAYRELQRWLVGSRVTSFAIVGDVWIVGTDRGWIVWAAGPNVSDWNVPAGVARMQRLDGSSARATAATYLPVAEPIFFSR